MSTTLAPLPMFNIAIEPPADIASVIDKTAYFVAKVGADFERRVFENEKNNPKFTFLKPTDSYHPYYQLKIRTYIDQQTKSGELVAPALSVAFQPQTSQAMLVEPQQLEIPSINTGEELVSSQQKRGFNYISERVVQTVRRSKTTPIPEFPPEQFMMDIPADISAMDLDIIRLTAQFVAKNGHQFQVGLLNREHKNPQFDFLKQNHPQHTFFLALVEAYTRCLNPPKNIAERLRSEYKDKHYILDRLIMKFDSEKQVEKARIEKETVEKKQMEAAANTVDWYDFVVVETIDFTDDDFRLPTMLPVFPTGPVEEPMQMEDVSMDVEEEEPKAKPAEFKVKKDYIKGQAPSTISKALKFAVCPKCGKEIPVDEMEEHMRVELLDPRYRIQKQNILDRSRGVSIASNDEISKNLQLFAKKRGDIFGKESELEAADEPEEKKDDKVIWDGHTGSIPATINAAISSAIEQQTKPKEDKEKVFPGPTSSSSSSSSSATVAPPPGIAPKAPQASPVGAIRIAPPPGIYIPPPPQSAPKLHPSPAEEPSSKKQKTDDGGFVSEEEFLARHGNGNITIKIQVPLDDKKPEWKLQGQTLSVQVSMKDTGATLKEKIKELTGVPPNKQKVKGPTFPIMRDDQTMAGYNLLNGSVLSLALKERGGKNK